MNARKVVVVRYDSDGQIIEGNFKDGVIGEASTMKDAQELAMKNGFELVDFDTPDNIPGELIGEDLDAFAVSVIST